MLVRSGGSGESFWRQEFRQGKFMLLCHTYVSLLTCRFVTLYNAVYLSEATALRHSAGDVVLLQKQQLCEPFDNSDLLQAHRVG